MKKKIGVIFKISLKIILGLFCLLCLLVFFYKISDPDYHEQREVRKQAKILAKEYIKNKYGENLEIGYVYVATDSVTFFDSKPTGVAIVNDKNKEYSVFVNIKSGEIGDDKQIPEIKKAIEDEFIATSKIGTDYRLTYLKVVDNSQMLNQEYLSETAYYKGNIDEFLRENKIGIRFEVFWEAENYTTEEQAIELLNNYKKRIEEYVEEIKDIFYYKGTELSISVVKAKSFSDENNKNRTYSYMDSLLTSPKYRILTADLYLVKDINDKENLLWDTYIYCFNYKEIAEGLYVMYNQVMADAYLLKVDKLDYFYPIYLDKSDKNMEIKIKDIYTFVDNKKEYDNTTIKIDKSKFLNGILLNKNIRFGYIKSGEDINYVVDLTENYIDDYGATDDNYIYIETPRRELGLIVFELDEK